MYPVLFIGGVMDGERIKMTRLLPTATCPTAIEIPGPKMPWESPLSVIKNEDYRLCRLEWKDAAMNVYVHTDVENPLKRLVDGYTPRKTQR